MAHFIEDMMGPSGDVSPEENTRMRQATPGDWNAALQRQNEEDFARQREQETQRALARRRATISENSAMFNNVVQTDAGVRQQGRQLQRRAAVGVLSAFKLGAGVDGGRVPPSVYTMIGGMLGYDNKTQGIGNIQVGMDGSMTITPFANVNGQMQEQDPIQLPFETIYGMGLENPGVLTGDEMNALRSNAVSKQNLTEEMANRMYPAVPEGYGDANYVPVGGRHENGALNVGRAFSRGPRQRMGGSSFFSDGKGGFVRTYNNESTGFQTVAERSGTLADDYKGQWKPLRGGGGQTTYKNDKTGDVVTVRDGETPPWVSSGTGSEKERIARMQEQGRNSRANMANDTKTRIAEMANELKKYGIDISAQVKEYERDQKASGASAKSARFDKDRYAAVKERLDAIRLDADGNPRTDLSEDEKKKVAAFERQMDAMLAAEETPDDGGDALTPQQKAAQILRAKQGGGSQGGMEQGDTAQDVQTPTDNSGDVATQQQSGTQSSSTVVPTADDIKKTVQEKPANISEDDEGMRSAEIKNWEYLSDEDKKTIKRNYQESETEDFDEAAVNAAQKKADEAKAASDANWETIEKELKAKLVKNGWTETRISRAIERAKRKWMDEHDAATKQKNEQQRMKNAMLDALATSLP